MGFVVFLACLDEVIVALPFSYVRNASAEAYEIVEEVVIDTRKRLDVGNPLWIFPRQKRLLR